MSPALLTLGLALAAGPAPRDEAGAPPAPAGQVRTGLALLEVSAAVAGAVVSVDERVVGLAPRSEWLTPGAHLVVVEAPARPPHRELVTLEKGERRALRVDFTPLPARDRALPLAGLVTASAGVVVGVIGLFLRLPAEDAARQVSALYQRGGGWDAYGASLEAAGLSAQTWSWFLCGAGLALLVSGGVVMAVEWFGAKAPPVALVPTPGGLQLSWGTRF